MADDTLDAAGRWSADGLEFLGGRASAAAGVAPEVEDDVAMLKDEGSSLQLETESDEWS